VTFSYDGQQGWKKLLYSSGSSSQVVSSSDVESSLPHRAEVAQAWWLGWLSSHAPPVDRVSQLKPNLVAVSLCGIYLSALPGVREPHVQGCAFHMLPELQAS
jgi:hypothetical protein